MNYTFSEASKRKVKSFLNLLKNDLYNASTKLDIKDVTFGTIDAYCQCYIIKFNFKGMIYYNGYRDFDLMHICTRKDSSGLIDYIKIYPEKNLKTNTLLDRVKQTKCLFGLNICKVEEDREYDNSSIVRVVRLYVV